MPELSFRYTARDRGVEERDLLLLEQEEWNPYTGLLTRAGFLRYLRALLYGTRDEDAQAAARILCPGDDLRLRIHAWPLAPGVSFRLRASVGELGEVTVGTVRAGESVAFQLSDRGGLRHPADRIEAVRWLTGPYNADGATIAPPAVSVSGDGITLSEPVWGAAWIESAGTRYTCELSIPKDLAEPRLAAGWSEYVLGLPDGGRPVPLELTPPPGAAELATLEGERKRCGRVNYRIAPAGDSEPTAQPKDKRIDCRYCPLTCEEPTYG